MQGSYGEIPFSVNLTPDDIKERAKGQIPCAQDIRPDAEPPKDFTRFMELVNDSLAGQAKRKGYNDTGADGENELYKYTVDSGMAAGHSMGEVTYKAREYMKDPRQVLLIKIAAWAFLEWKYGRNK